MLKTLVILSGNFTANGNYSAYPDEGDRVHIYGEQMKNIFPAEKDIKFPFYVLAKDKEFDELDTNGAPTGVKFVRSTATAVFKNVEDVVAAKTAGRKIDLMATAELRTFGAGLQLDDATINALVAATI